MLLLDKQWALSPWGRKYITTRMDGKVAVSPPPAAERNRHVHAARDSYPSVPGWWSMPTGEVHLCTPRRCVQRSSARGLRWLANMKAGSASTTNTTNIPGAMSTNATRAHRITCSRRIFSFFVFFQVDLRSATELGHDELIHGDIYEGFVNVGRGEHGGTGVWEGPAWDEAIVEESNETVAAGTIDGDAGSERRRRRRYFVSLIDESIYKKGVFQRLRRRHKVRAWCFGFRGGTWGPTN